MCDAVPRARRSRSRRRRPGGPWPRRTCSWRTNRWLGASEFRADSWRILEYFCGFPPELGGVGRIREFSGRFAGFWAEFIAGIWAECTAEIWWGRGGNAEKNFGGFHRQNSLAPAAGAERAAAAGARAHAPHYGCHSSRVAVHTHLRAGAYTRQLLSLT